MVHEATVAEADAQHHSILSSGTVSLWKQINDAHSHLGTKASSHFLIQTHSCPGGEVRSFPQTVWILTKILQIPN